MPDEGPTSRDAAAASNLALLHAAARGEWERVHVLLDEGANMEEVDAAGRTALMMAAQLGQAHIVDDLLDRGARAPRSRRRILLY